MTMLQNATNCCKVCSVLFVALSAKAYYDSVLLVGTELALNKV